MVYSLFYVHSLVFDVQLDPEGIKLRRKFVTHFVKVAEVIVHEGYFPDIIIDFVESDFLVSKSSTDMDFASFHTDATTVGDDQCFVIPWIGKIY